MMNFSLLPKLNNLYFITEKAQVCACAFSYVLEVLYEMENGRYGSRISRELHVSY